MKAILVVEMPQTCDECQFSWNTDEEWKVSCQLEHDLGTSKGKKPEWCPLKPMPEKYIEREIKIETERDVEVCTHGITLGRNLLIEELEK